MIPAQLGTIRISNHTRLIHTLLKVLTVQHTVCLSVPYILVLRAVYTCKVQYIEQGKLSPGCGVGASPSNMYFNFTSCWTNLFRIHNSYRLQKKSLGEIDHPDQNDTAVNVIGTQLRYQ